MGKARRQVIDCRRGRWDSKQIIDEIFLVEDAHDPKCHFVEKGVIDSALWPFLVRDAAAQLLPRLREDRLHQGQGDARETPSGDVQVAPREIQ
jgi:hypothetical protein